MTEHGVCPSEENMEYEEEIARLRQSNGKLVQAILDHKAINAELLAALTTIEALSWNSWQGYTAHAVAYELAGVARDAIERANA